MKELLRIINWKKKTGRESVVAWFKLLLKPRSLKLNTVRSGIEPGSLTATSQLSDLTGLN